MEEKKTDKSQKSSRLEMVFGIIFGFSTAGVIVNLLIAGFSPDPAASSARIFWFIIALISGFLMFYFRLKK
jgi:hypothetical protein